MTLMTSQTSVKDTQSGYTSMYAQAHLSNVALTYKLPVNKSVLIPNLQLD